MRIRLVAVFMLLLAALPAAARDGFITTSDGVKLHYIDEGSGPALVLVPGWTMPAEIWRPQITGLARNFRVVALDMRAYGKSDIPSEGYYPERRVLDLHEAITQLKLGPVVLAGWSLGVPEILTYVEKHGAAGVRGLVLVDGMVGSDPDRPLDKAFHGFLLAMQKDRAGWTRAFVRSMYKKPQSEEYLKSVETASLRVPTPMAFTLLSNYLAVGDWRPILKSFGKPVLFAYSSPDMKAPADESLKLVPPARVEFFEGAGHALFVDDAERFNAAVRRFMESLDAVPAPSR